MNNPTAKMVKKRKVTVSKKKRGKNVKKKSSLEFVVENTPHTHKAKKLTHNAGYPDDPPLTPLGHILFDPGPPGTYHIYL